MRHSQKCPKEEAPHCLHRLRQGIHTSRMDTKGISIATESKLRVDLMEKRHSTAQFRTCLEESQEPGEAEER